MNHYARRIGLLVGGCFTVVAVSQGCSPGQDTIDDRTTGGGDTTSSSSGMGGGAASSSSSSGEGGDIFMTGSSSSGEPGPMCDGPKGDKDNDGFMEGVGPGLDCNDCDPFVNPGAVDVVAEPDMPGGPVPMPADENCDGTKDNITPPCDAGLAKDSMDPLDAARAMGICDLQYVKSAKWVLADGSPPPVDPTKLANFHLGHGILPDFGPNNPAKEGSAVLVLSSGTARMVGDPEYVHRNFDKGYVSNFPFGFPKESATCPGVKTLSPRDATAVEFEFVAPTNVQGISFDFNFFTFEWPQFICTTFNDFFIANLTYADPLKFPKGQVDGNISFDANKNPISVNNAFVDVCGCAGGAPCPTPPPPKAAIKTFDCALGTKIVEGTDFAKDDANVGWTNGATGWLRTSAPVDPGKKFTLRLVTYDSSDGFVDSLTVIDNWKWSAQPGKVETVKPPQ